MDQGDSNSALVAALRSRFPAEAALTDHWLRDRDFTDDRTTEAVRRWDAEVVRAQTNFIAAAFQAEPDALRTIVDVSYAENLMCDASTAEKQWAWRLIAAEIRQLFCRDVGNPTSDPNSLSISLSATFASGPIAAAPHCRERGNPYCACTLLTYGFRHAPE